MYQYRLLLMMFLVFVLGFFFVAAVDAADIIASSTELADVIVAINMAQPGDTVIIPSGTSIWTSGVSIPDNKQITVRGAGAANTVIIGGNFNLRRSGSRLTQIGTIGTGTSVVVYGSGWRIDRCRFENSGSGIIEGIQVSGQGGPHPVGVIDHCEFVNTRVNVYGDANLTAHGVWAQPLGLGTNNAVFIEDNTFTYTIFSNALDSHYGGRYVFRYNIVVDGYIEAHSADEGGYRGSRSWEIYENMISQAVRSMYMPFRLRGGTGVVFKNTVTGTWGSPNIGLDNVRSCSGECDGTNLQDGNIPGENGYPCRDQIGRSTDQWLWTTENPYPPQALDPAYAWNNTNESGQATFVTIQCQESRDHIQEDRDFYNEQKPGYTPFTYPHPLVQNDAEGWLEPPKNLRVVE